MSIKSFTSRFVVTLLLLLGCAMTMNAAQTWKYGQNKKNFKFSGGDGTHSAPYLISNAQDLADLAYLVTENNNDVTGWYFKQTADITLTDITVSADGKTVSGSSGAQEWTPIGEWGWTCDDDFQGIYDGGGHYISGLYIAGKSKGRDYIGLFGSCEDAIIKNLTLKNVYINMETLSEDAYIGGLVGRAAASTISNVKIENCVINSTSWNEEPCCGGFVGYIDSANGSLGKVKTCYFTNCTFDGNINVNGWYSTWTGGFLGSIKSAHASFNGCKTGKRSITLYDKCTKNDNHSKEISVGGYVGDCKGISGTASFIDCVNNMSISVERKGTNTTHKWGNIKAYLFAGSVSVINFCANFGNIELGNNIVNSDMLLVGNTPYVESLNDNVSYGLFKCNASGSDNIRVLPFTYDRQLPSVYLANGFIVPKECINQAYGASYEYKDKMVSLAYIKANALDGDQIVSKRNSTLGKRLWGTSEGDGNGPYSIKDCPLPISCGGKSVKLMGTGTESDPYLISTEADLRGLQQAVEDGSQATEGKFFKMTDDIDFTDKEPMEGIGTVTNEYNREFKGTFDGDGHVISNLTEKGAGLFQYLDGTVKNLGIVNMTFTGSNGECAPIAYKMGNTKGGTISNCYVGGTINMTTTSSNESLYLAGLCAIVGTNSNKIENSYFKGAMNISSNGKNSTYHYYGLVADAQLAYGKLTCNSCYASFTTAKIDESDYAQNKKSVNGLFTQNYTAGATNCWYVCPEVTLTGDNDKLDSDTKLAEHFTGDAWKAGAFRPVLKSTRLYTLTDYKGNTVYTDAIPMGDGTNDIYNFDLSKEENVKYSNDPLLWSLPNVAVYNPGDKTDYILNCSLVAKSDFHYTKNDNATVAKGAMHYPLTVSQNGYSMLCLPCTIRREDLPEDSKLYVCGELTKEDDRNIANMVECGTVPAGVPFIVYTPTSVYDSEGETSLVGTTHDIVLRGEIVGESKNSMLLDGQEYQTGMVGSFVGKDNMSACTDIKVMNEGKDDEQIVATYTNPATIAPFAGYFSTDKPVYFTDYILLDETSDDIGRIIDSNKGKTVNIKLKRALKYGGWNSVCLPFDMSATEINEAFGDGTLVEELSSASNAGGACTLSFVGSTDGIKAGVAYLVKPGKQSLPTVLSFTGKTLTSDVNPSAEDKDISGSNATICLQGTYVRQLLEGNDANGGLYFTQSDKIYKVGENSRIIMNGFRCFIKTSEPDALSAARIIHNDGTTTDLRLVEVGSTANGGHIYNIQGMQMAEPAGRGVYIKNGRKYVK